MTDHLLPTLLTVSILANVLLPSPSLAELQSGVRGVATKAPENMAIDGDLKEFEGAFCTPIEYHNANLQERAAQFFYLGCSGEHCSFLRF